ncbi:hypothetical protein [Streptomyces sp. NPDC046979]|uniref:hypothetical protein n=1 Tax=Streptomyces sp. NPDC046979 TaxID=3154604 RepID=UPI0033F6DAA2
MVHTRGFGRSTSCPDFGESGEQADAKAAINWSAKESWSHRHSRWDSLLETLRGRFSAAPLGALGVDTHRVPYPEGGERHGPC